MEYFFITTFDKALIRKMTRFLHLLLVLLLVVTREVIADDAVVTLRFLDVGEGDVALIISPLGKTLLVDTGNLITGVNVIRELQARSIEKLDNILLTHPHPDHIGGVFSIIQLFHPMNVFDNGEPLGAKSKHEDIFRWYQELVRLHPRYRKLSQGDQLFLDDVVLDVLWPPHPLPSHDWNTNSLVMRLRFGQFRCLLMGDANLATEHALQEKQMGNLSAQVMKAGHHGALDTADPSFLKEVSPKTVIISVNGDNVRGYPASETLDKFNQVSAEVFRTDENGTIEVQGRNDGSFTVSTATRTIYFLP